MQSPGAHAILPGVIDTALAANVKLRVLTTFPVQIDQYLRARGHRPARFNVWRIGFGARTGTKKTTSSSPPSDADSYT